MKQIIQHYLSFNCWRNKFSKCFFYPYVCPKGHTITPKLNFCPKCCQKYSIKFTLIISNIWCQIVLVPNSLVPNCPNAKLSRCLIVRFYYLCAKLSGAKLSHNQKKGSSVLIICLEPGREPDSPAQVDGALLQSLAYSEMKKKQCMLFLTRYNYCKETSQEFRMLSRSLSDCQSTI